VKHAGPDALDSLEPMIAALRAFDGIVEKKRGVFYRKSQAFLHFHEDPKGLFCDVRLDPSADFERFPVTTTAEQKTLLKRIAKSLS